MRFKWIHGEDHSVVTPGWPRMSMSACPARMKCHTALFDVWSVTSNAVSSVDVTYRVYCAGCHAIYSGRDACKMPSFGILQVTGRALCNGWSPWSLLRHRSTCHPVVFAMLVIFSSGLKENACVRSVMGIRIGMRRLHTAVSVLSEIRSGAAQR